MRMRKRAVKYALLELTVCWVLGSLLFVLWGVNSESISDHAAYTLVHYGDTRRQVERSLPCWTPQTLQSDDGQPKEHPGYSIVRYRYWFNVHVYIDVTYDGKNRVVMSNCNG